MSNVNPTNVWLSDHILLSDLVGCDSVYRYGIGNPVTDADGGKIKEGRHLASVLEPYIANRAVSFTYGYVCPKLSKAIVKYQNPDKPSYHRWDAGAALDMSIHTRLDVGLPKGDPWTLGDDFTPDYPPILQLLHMYKSGLRWSRAITYAESDIFCFGTRAYEHRSERYRMATYENEYVPEEPEPRFIKLSPKKLEQHGIPAAYWRGKGWPSYHGGGRRQYEHVRTGPFNLLSDFLYDPILVHKGIPNKPPLGRAANNNFLTNVMLASICYEHIVYRIGCRLPIVAAYVNPASRHTKIDRSFQDGFVMDLKVPRSLSVEEVYEIAKTYAIGETQQLNSRVLRIAGPTNQDINYGLARASVIVAKNRLEFEREFFKSSVRK